MNGPDPRATELLSQLRDIHLPEPVSAWPPAPGWWILAALSLVVLVLLLHWIYRRYQRSAFRKQAFQELENLQADTNNASLYLQELNRLLKRSCLICHPNSDTASLSGKRWLEFLDHSGDTYQFTQGAGQALMHGPYQPAPASDELNELNSLVKQWLKRQQRPC